MDAFQHLSVLISIIVGFGISHLLAGAARLIQLRRRVRMHLPTLLMMALLFVLQVQIWWVFFEKRGETEWTFFSFLFFLLIPILASLNSYLLVPELSADEPVDLRASYHEIRPWFFGLLGATVTVSLTRDLVVDGWAAFDADAGFRIVFLLFSVAAAVVRRDVFHVVLAITAFALFLAYVFFLFLELA